MKACIRALFLICLVALVTGCGVRNTYNNLDWLAVRWLDSQVDLSAEQERQVRSALQRKLAWHCENELPDYIALIERIDRDVATSRITVEDLEAYGQEISALGRRLLDRAQPSIIDFLAGLDDQQVDNLIESIHERNDELENDRTALTPEQRQAELVEGMERSLRRLIGRLNADQRARLEQWAQARQPDSTFEREQREARDQQFIQALAVRTDPVDFERRMNTLFELAQPDSPPEPGPAQHATAHNRTNMLNTLVDIYELADDRQIKRMRNRLEDLADDFQEVSCRVQD